MSTRIADALEDFKEKGKSAEVVEEWPPKSESTEESDWYHEEWGANPDDWKKPVPERKWLIPSWLPAGRIAILTGKGGQGKSRLALQIAAAIAAGESHWLPGARESLQREEGVAAVIASWEDERDEVARRLEGMKKAVGDRLRYISPKGSLWEPHPDGFNHTSATGQLSHCGSQLRKYCAEVKARLLVIDPRAAAYGLNENDRALVRQFMASWDTWAQKTSCAVLLIAHPPKTESSYSGSTDWHAAARTVWELGLEDTEEKTARGKRKEGTGEDLAPRLTCTKANYVQIPSSYWLSGYPVWKVEENPKTAADKWQQRMQPVGTQGQRDAKYV